ncbi:MAG: GntR family transcriptional regulator, partial [Brevibacterium aurantiacum]|nr:GntR family transcriptional regulator [Brevibacterium aurantiacum]
MAAGEQFPPERQLAEALGISRMTLRRAIDELV